MKIQQLDEIRLKEEGWTDIYIQGASSKVHIFHYFAGIDKKNIIVLHTPVIAIKSCYECFEQLGRVYSFNVFALDYAPGEGECSGRTQDFTLENIVLNIDAVYNYIKENYSDQIHLLGYTGAGGIFAQYYLANNPDMKSFSQFACGIYGDTKPIGVPSILATPFKWFSRFIIKLNPNSSISFKPPKAKGYHAELDNEFYDTITIREPHFFDLKINNALQLIECMTDRKKLINTPIQCPTLVFKTLHDRYFSRDYFDRYYQKLTCEKKLVEIDDTHNSYFTNPEQFMREIACWVNEH